MEWYNNDVSVNTKRWGVVFRTMANPNRLRIIKLLMNGEKLSVTDISEKLEISFKALSNHLALLKNLDVVESRGAEGHVFYWLNRELPKDFRKAIDIVLK